MTIRPTVVVARITLVALSRRRTTLAILVLLPVAFYFARDTTGQSVRSLLFGISWAVSTVAYFASTEARALNPRLVLAGWSPLSLNGGRLLGLITGGSVLSAGFLILVLVDKDVRSATGVGLALVAATLTGVAFGSLVGSLVSKEMEGVLILFLFAGLQAVLNPIGTVAKFLPFWSSRELGTYAVDGPDQGSLQNGILHGLAVIALAGLATAAQHRLSPHRRAHVAYPTGSLSQS